MDLIKAFQAKTNITVDLKVWTSYGYAVGNFHENISTLVYKQNEQLSFKIKGF